MVCWRGYSLHDCTAEFGFFWLNSKLAETGVCNPPSMYHNVVPIYESDQMGLQTAYLGTLPYHAHYHTGNTPLALVWKDENCSQYVIEVVGVDFSLPESRHASIPTYLNHRCVSKKYILNDGNRP
ncbi:hypothetical protein MKW92_051258, partial [Papaver armeniacum]